MDAPSASIAQVATDGTPDSYPNTSEFETPMKHSPLHFAQQDKDIAELKHLELSPDIISEESRVIGNGTFGDVTSAICAHPRRGQVKVAIKYLRIFDQKEVINLFKKEVYVWSKFNHPNVLPLIGFFFDNKFGYPSFVSKWMQNGSAWNYVRNEPDHDLNRLVIGAAEGLTYLHEKHVIHSDIKPDNIVVTSSGDACICDFGGSRIITSSKSLAKPTSRLKGTQIYNAYELVALPTNDGHTKATDVWAFGMTIYALLTHQHPYTQDFQVYKLLPEHKLPLYPSSDSWSPQRLEAKEKFWNVCQLCWNFNPAIRASMPVILSHLQTSPSPEPVPEMDVDKTDKEHTIDIEFEPEPEIEADVVSPKSIDSESTTSLNSRAYTRYEENQGLLSIKPSEDTYYPLFDTESQKPMEGTESASNMPSTSANISDTIEINYTDEDYRYKALALYTHKASLENPDRISFTKGDELRVAEMQGNWLPAMKEDGSVGLAPSNYLQIIHDEERIEPVDAITPEEDDLPMDTYPFKAMALYTFNASPGDSDKISFVKEEELELKEKQGNWLHARKTDGTIGTVPSNYLQFI